jgi:hypothetical protein
MLFGGVFCKVKYKKLRKNTMPRRFAPRRHPLISLNVKIGGVYLKKSELILHAIGSAGGIPPEPPFRPPRLEAEAKRTFSSFLFRF